MLIEGIYKSSKSKAINKKKGSKKVSLQEEQDFSQDS